MPINYREGQDSKPIPNYFDFAEVDLHNLTYPFIY